MCREKLQTLCVRKATARGFASALLSPCVCHLINACTRLGWQFQESNNRTDISIEAQKSSARGVRVCRERRALAIQFMEFASILCRSARCRFHTARLCYREILHNAKYGVERERSRVWRGRIASGLSIHPSRERLLKLLMAPQTVQSLYKSDNYPILSSKFH
jgi:hypothetical protein